MVNTEKYLINGKDPCPACEPNAIEKNILTNMHIANIALLLDDNPIEMEYIEAVITKVASVGLPFVLQTSISNGSMGTSICNITHATNSVNSSEIPLIGLLGILLLLLDHIVIWINLLKLSLAGHSIVSIKTI